MKSYKNVELFAKNAPTGSYAAGCPTHTRTGNDTTRRQEGNNIYFAHCADCEVAS